MSSSEPQDNNGSTIDQFIKSVCQKKGVGLIEEYIDIVSKDKIGTFEASTKTENSFLNRYFNIKCFDDTRVILDSHDVEGNVQRDYINANYIDGYNQPNAYISTQGPLPGTKNDFWRMIWQTRCRNIVMVTRLFENEMAKCDPYWPTSEAKTMDCGAYTVDFVAQDVKIDFTLRKLNLTNKKSQISREINHFQFTSWPDFGVPESADELLEFRECIFKKQLETLEHSSETSDHPPPITVHCSAGVGRSGTFITIDICIRRLEATGLIDIRGVVEKLRSQRYSSIQTKEQYIFCHAALLEYAANTNFLREIESVRVDEVRKILANSTSFESKSLLC